jgi:hypothetical protein
MFVAVGDVNGDGKLDVLTANACINGSDCSSATVGVLLGNGTGMFSSAIRSSKGIAGHPAIGNDLPNLTAETEHSPARARASLTVAYLLPG